MNKNYYRSCLESDCVMREENNHTNVTMEELAKYSIKASNDFVDNLRRKREADSSQLYQDKGENLIQEFSKIDFFNAFDLDYGDVVSIIGAGGKTSLMYYLARLAKEQEMRVLITTSTHIAIPDREDIKIFKDFTDLKRELRQDPTSSVYVYAQMMEEEKKFSAIDPVELEMLIQDFDIFFIEADGAKRKSLKGWRDFEPVIYPYSNKCIMVLPCDYYDEVVEEEKIFEAGLFAEQFIPSEVLKDNSGSKYKIDNEVYLNILDSTQGPFAKAEDRPLYLYLSRSDLISTEKLSKIVENLSAGIKRRGYREIKFVHSSGVSLMN